MTVDEGTRARQNPVEVSDCPYVGLVPFTADHQSYFFGRDRDIDLISANLQAFRLTLLYGPSGVGKTSILGAGVVPALRSNSDDERSLVISMSSWRDDVSHGIDAAAAKVASELGFLLPPTGEEAPLTDRLRMWSEQIGGVVYCIFDQFEEYFLYHEDKQERFGMELCRALSADLAPAHFLISLREDALGQLDRFQPFVPNLFANHYRLEHLRSDEARQAINGPLQRYNEHRPRDDHVFIEPALVEEVLAEVRTGEVLVGAAGEGRVAGAVERDEIETAHLQLVMSRLWIEEAIHGSAVIRLETLQRLGGSASIVRSHLDATMELLPEADRDMAADVFRQLVTPSGAKIAHSLEDLAEYANVAGPELSPVLEHLADGQMRILRSVPPAPGQPDASRYEIFHDALAPAILDWRHRRSTQQQRADAERRLAESRRSLRTERRRRGRLVILLGVSVVLLLAAAFFLVRTIRKEHEQRSARLVAQSIAMMDADPIEATRLALRAWHEDHGAAAEDAVRRAGSFMLATSSLVGHTDAVTGVDVSGTRSNPRLLTTSSDGSARVWNTSGDELTRLDGHTRPLIGGRFSPDGSRVVTWSDDHTIRVWDAASGKQLAMVDGYAAYADDVDVSSDGRLVASVMRSGSVLVWDATSGAAVRELEMPGTAIAYALRFNPVDPKVVFTGDSEGGVRAWDVDSGAQLASTGDPSSYYINVIAVSPDGGTVAAGRGFVGTFVWRWHETTTAPVAYSEKFGTESVSNIAFSPDGDSFVAAARKTAVLWRYDASTGDWQEQASVAHADWVTGVAFSPGGEFFVSVSRDGTGLVGDGQTGQRLAELHGQVGGLTDVAITPGGGIVTSADDGTAAIWSLPRAQSLPGHTDWVLDLDITDDSKTAVSAGLDGQIIGWDLDSNKQVSTIGQIPDDENFGDSLIGLNVIAIDPAGRYVAAGDAYAPVVWVWNLKEGAAHPVAVKSAWAVSLAFAPDGSQLAVSTYDGHIELWDWRTDEPSRTIVSGGGAAFIEWSRDGALLAGGLANGDIVVWDAKTLEPLVRMTGHSGQVWDVAFSPDGTRIASAGQDRTARIWDVTSGRELHRMVGHEFRLATIEYSPDGGFIVTGDVGGMVGIWDAETGRPQAFTRAHADPVNALKVLQDGSILSAGDDQALRRQSCAVCQPISQLVDDLQRRVDALPRPYDRPERDQKSVLAIGSGECIGGIPTADEIDSIAPVDCALPHEAEVFATFALSDPWDAPLPPADELLRRAEEACGGDTFRTYVGADQASSRFDLAPLGPTEDGWTSGDRRITCILIGDASTTGSARGSGS